jgi:predicted RNA-binding Zn ribbon-like protein
MGNGESFSGWAMKLTSILNFCQLQPVFLVTEDEDRFQNRRWCSCWGNRSRHHPHGY